MNLEDELDEIEKLIDQPFIDENPFYVEGNIPDHDSNPVNPNEPIFTESSTTGFYGRGNRNYSGSTSFKNRFERKMPASHLLSGNGIRRSSTAVTPNGHPLVRTDSVNAKYCCLFSKYEFFNSMQSECFHKLLHSNENVVVSAPTGSGKTLVMEFAIVKLLSECGQSNPLIVYLAPLKALCSERTKDWTEKFERLEVKVKEVTGDTVDSGYGVFAKSDIIVTTPEKWDSITRHWRNILSHTRRIQLVLIDEVHLLNEKRGATLEILVSRMKAIDNEVNSKIRFVAISATIPNIQDIAEWLGYHSRTCARLAFGEEYRPVPLIKKVIGFNRQERNDFTFEINLNYKLPEIIAQYSQGKSSLVFCSTRKSASSACETLKKNCNFQSDRSEQLSCRIHDKKLGELFRVGIAFHHAGLSSSDRNLIEKSFLDVICCTSTLAIGVNLPAHLVIIKSTMQYVGRVYQEYSDLDILQMMGRAGRPQFDTSGTVIIMTEDSKVQKYENLCHGKAPIESCLHENIIEYLNAEIVNGTIKSIPTALEWLKSTFLYVRIQKNPDHYELKEGMEQMIVGMLNQLDNHGFITMTDDIIAPTGKSDSICIIKDIGNSMAKYCIKYETMVHITKIQDHYSMADLIRVISLSEDFELRFQQDKMLLNILNKSIKYPLKRKVKDPSDRAYVLIQVGIGDVEIGDQSKAATETRDISWILSIAPRILKTMIGYCELKKLGLQLKDSISLLASVNAKCWSDSSHVIRQVEKLGKVLAEKLNNKGIHSIETLRSTDAQQIELILGRNHPFGLQIHETIDTFPQFAIQVSFDQTKSNVDCVLELKNYEKVKTKIKGSNHTVNVHLMIFFKKGKSIELGLHKNLSHSYLQNCKKFSVNVDSQVEQIQVYAMSEEYVGFDKDYVLNIKKPALVVDDDFVPDEILDTILDYDEPGNESNDQPITPQVITTRPIKPTEEEKICKHTCKDRQKCKHECCKGVFKKKRRTEDNPDNLPMIIDDTICGSSSTWMAPINALHSATTPPMKPFRFKKLERVDTSLPSNAIEVANENVPSMPLVQVTFYNPVPKLTPPASGSAFRKKEIFNWLNSNFSYQPKENVPNPLPKEESRRKIMDLFKTQ